MPASHAAETSVTSTDDELPGLLEVLARVRDPRRKRGRRYTLVFILAVAAVCALAGARGFREIGDHAADLPQELLMPSATQRNTSPGRKTKAGGAATTSCSKGNQAGLQRAIYDLIQADCPRDPDYVEIDYGHGRIIKRSLWVTDAAGLDFPHARRAVRIRRDGYDATGTQVSKEIVHAVTSLGAERAEAADLARIARGQRGIESAHWLRDTAYQEDKDSGYAGNGPQVMATLRNLASACSAWPGSLRSPAPSRPSAETVCACSITCRSETRLTNDATAWAVAVRAARCALTPYLLFAFRIDEVS